MLGGPRVHMGWYVTSFQSPTETLELCRVLLIVPVRSRPAVVLGVHAAGCQCVLGVQDRPGVGWGWVGVGGAGKTRQATSHFLLEET